jgi:hypothetical protein
MAEDQSNGVAPTNATAQKRARRVCRARLDMEDLHASDPRTVGPYRILRRIGTGGMGVVYLAEDTSGRQVALKLLRPELADDAGFRARFRREVEAGQRVGGICTARHVDADLESEHPYLATEYVAGGNLYEYVTAHGPLQGEQLVGLAVGLAEALVAMNAVGVIHRDLKPSNVLMAPTGPKVVDFGISHAADGTALTQTGNVMGSPGWMAPEQALGHGTTEAIDVFSWGATVAFAATGRSPFGEGRPEAILYRVVHEQPDLNGLDPRLWNPVVSALQKDPALRPPPDRLLVELVRTAMAGGIPPGGSIAMTTAVLDQTWFRPPAPSMPVPQEKTKRGRVWLAVAAFVLVAGAIAGGVFALSHETPKTGSAAQGQPKGAAGSSSGVSTTEPSTTTTTAQASPTAIVSADLPLQICPTSFAVDPAPSAANLPASMTESVPRDLQDQLTVYSDDQGDMKLLGPTGWVCSANYGADGSGGLTVNPSGEVLPTEGIGTTSSLEVIDGSESSACVGCTEGQACPLFASAAIDYQNDYRVPCPTSKPSVESVEPIENGVIGFLDPPGVTGDGAYSGGTYPANGVMTYHSGDDNGSWEETCVLRYSQQTSFLYSDTERLCSTVWIELDIPRLQLVKQPA